mgnify:CR=1 FL=1
MYALHVLTRHHWSPHVLITRLQMLAHNRCVQPPPQPGLALLPDLASPRSSLLEVELLLELWGLCHLHRHVARDSARRAKNNGKASKYGYAYGLKMVATGREILW